MGSSTLVRSSLVLTAVLAAANHAPAQESRAILDAPLVVTSRERLRFVVDLEGDGFDDVVSWQWTDDVDDDIWLSGHQNDGTGKLIRRWNRRADGPWTTSAEIAMGGWRAHGDALGDFWLIVNDGTKGDFFAYTSNGLTAPTVRNDLAWHSTTTNIVGVHLFDWNGDTFTDRTLLGSDGWLHMWSGDGVSTTLCSSLFVGTAFEQMIPFDGNGDALPDLLLVRGAEIQLVTTSGCQLDAPQVWNTDLPGHPMAVAGDIDGDLDEDAVVFDMTGYVVLRRTGAASFQLEPYESGGTATDLVDIDLDGDLDGVCCGGGSGGNTPHHVNNVSTFRVSLNDGTGAFAPAIEIPGLGAHHLGGASDMDHDGDVDLVAGRCIYFARGPITSDPMPRIGSRGQSARTVADFDMDGDPDLECWPDSVWRNRGDGRFQSATPWGVEAPAGMELRGPGFPGDYDGDGDDDLIVAMHSIADGVFQSMRLLANNGGGGLVDVGDAGAPGVGFAAAPGLLGWNASVATDIEADGDIDLVTRTNDAPALSKIWLNDGTGFFTAGQTLNYRFHAATDINGDTIPDAVTATDDIRIFWGVGGGAFGGSSGLNMDLDGYADHFSVVDADGDGDEDIVVVDWYQGYLYGRGRVYLNHLNGSLEETTAVSLLSSRPGPARAGLATDIDGDGDTDLLLGPGYRSPSAIHVVLWDEVDDRWDSSLMQVVWHNDGTNAIVHPGTLADVDGDGDDDYLTNRLIRNTTYAGPDAGRRLQFGPSLHSAGGMPPTWGGKGPFRPGENAELRLTGAAPGIVGIFTAGYRVTRFDAPTPAVEPFLITHRFEFKTSGLPSDEPGTGSWTLSYVVPAYKAGRHYRYQVDLLDPSGRFGYARPNQLIVEYGQ